jgi:hypothetical protein
MGAVHSPNRHSRGTLTKQRQFNHPLQHFDWDVHTIAVLCLVRDLLAHEGNARGGVSTSCFCVERFPAIASEPLGQRRPCVGYIVGYTFAEFAC